MKITFFSNYLNHHQFLFCKALCELTDGQFRFVADIPIKEERLKLGYRDMNRESFVIRSYEDEEQKAEAKRLCLESDVIIHGSAPAEYVDVRLKEGKCVFKYTERPFKKRILSYFKEPGKLLSFYQVFGKKQDKPFYVLCASAFVPTDLKKFGIREEKFFKFGYFPEVKEQPDLDALIAKKKKGSILWCGRLIDWKHPEVLLTVAKNLKKDGFDFHINVIGTGKIEKKIKNLVKRENLTEEISFLGSMSPEDVRKYMEESQIYLFTSDRQEGWGAVLNESMNSACAVVVSNAIGSAPFLIRDGENGFLYESGNTKELCEKVKTLLLDSEKRVNFGKKAYLTLKDVWNPRTAAERFVALSGEILAGKDGRDLFSDGVLSPAPVLKDKEY